MRNNIPQIVRVAELYFERNLSQKEIAAIIGTSRPRVSRLLADARRMGIVEIKINRPIEKLAELSETLRTQFKLRDAIVVESGETYLDSVRNVGATAAELLSSVLGNNMTIGMTWGQTLYHMVKALAKIPLEGIEVVQMLGALGEGDSHIDGPELALRLAEKLDGSYRYVHAPAVVKTTEMKHMLLQQPQIKATLQKAANADIMLQGIGSLADEMSSLARAGYLDEEERNACLEAGAVGHLMARMIDMNGQQIGSYNERVIAIPAEALRLPEYSIGICASRQKAKPALGAIRGQYINVLVTERRCAEALIELQEDVSIRTQV
ncbi:MAG: sugar-binding domain-containing protein [Chloroflexota bacterium]